MRKMWFLLLVVFMLAGCSSSWNQIVQDQWGLLAVKNASRALGYAVANSKSSVDDAAVIEAYNLFKVGQVDPMKINVLLGKFGKDPQNQLIVMAGIDLLQAMGATIVKGEVFDLKDIPPEVWATVETSYQQGYLLGKADRSKGVTRAIP